MRTGWIGKLLRGAAVAAGLALAGCAGDSGLEPDAAFSAGDPQTAGDGVLLVGMRLTRPATSYNIIFGTYEQPAEFEMVFRGVSAENHFTRVRRRVKVCNEIVIGFGNAAGGCDPLAPAYRLIRLPAGRYVLSDFILRAYKDVRMTNFTGSVHPLYIFSKPPPEPPPALVAFDVQPGRITYIGDFNWDPQHFPARFVMSRSDMAAEAAIYAHPLVSAPIVFAPVMHVPVGAYPD